MNKLSSILQRLSREGVLSDQEVSAIYVAALVAADHEDEVRVCGGTYAAEGLTGLLGEAIAS